MLLHFLAVALVHLIEVSADVYTSMDFVGDPGKIFVDELRQEHSLIAKYVGPVSENVGTTCHLLTVDFSSWIEGSVLLNSMKPLEESVRQHGVWDKQLYTETISVQKEILKKDFTEELDLHLNAMKHQKRSFTTTLGQIGAVLAFKGIEFAVERMNAYFRHPKYTNEVENLRQEVRHVGNALTREIKMKFLLIHAEQRKRLMDQAIVVMNELFNLGKVSRHLLDDKVKSVLKEILGPDMFHNSIYEKSPIESLSLLDIHVIGRNNDFLLTEICAPIIHQEKLRHLYRVQALGTSVNDHYLIPMISEYIAINDKFEKESALRVSNPKIDCKKIGRTHYCNRFQSMETDCMLTNYHDCRVDSQKMGKDFFHMRKIGEYVIVATTASEIELFYKGDSRKHRIKEQVFAVPLPENATLKVGKRTIFGTGILFANFTPHVIKEGDYEMSVSVIKDGIFYPKEERTASVARMALNSLLFICLTMTGLVIIVFISYTISGCVRQKVIRMKPKLAKLEKRVDKCRSKIFNFAKRNKLEFSGWDTSGDDTDLECNRKKKLIKRNERKYVGWRDIETAAETHGTAKTGTKLEQTVPQVVSRKERFVCDTDSEIDFD